MELKKLHDTLFNTKKDVYSVIDGAALPALLGKLEDHEGQSTCLFRGELPFDLAEAAPYLVKLKKDDAFTQWLLKESLESTCCIFAHSDKKFIKLRKHFRAFMRVEDPNGKRLLFRFYDPSVLRSFLPVCTPENNDALFDKINKYLMLSEDYKELLSFKKPKLEQNKEDYKNNIAAALTPINIEIEEPSKPEIDESFDEEKTIIMRIQKPPVETQEKPKLQPTITSDDDEIDLDKTVFMIRKPKS